METFTVSFSICPDFQTFREKTKLLPIPYTSRLWVILVIKLFHRFIMFKLNYSIIYEDSYLTLVGLL
jgi:hypothetical protein